MQITMLKSKIHRAAVTGASLHYEGSLTVSADIAKMVGLRRAAALQHPPSIGYTGLTYSIATRKQS
jgi:aspartate 1-decarboxylase